MFPSAHSPRPLAAVTLFLLALASATTPAARAAGLDLAPAQRSAVAYAERAADLHDALAAGEAVDDRAWDRLLGAWHRTPDLADRLETLARLQTRLTPPAPSLARARLAAFAADLQGHRSLAEAGEPGHDVAVRALTERIRASGEGTEAAPWRVTSAGDAVAFLRELGEAPVGGYYGAPGPFRLTLVVAARTPEHAHAVSRHFELSTTLAAWRDARAWSDTGISGRDARDFIVGLATQLDHFALTSRGLLTATERGEGGHYRAAKTLTGAADAGNGVARFSLGDLYLRLAERSPDIREKAIETAVTHYEDAAALGLGHAHLKLGMLARLAGDHATARYHLGFAHAADVRGATMELAALLHEADPARAEALLREAARAGNGEAAYELALLRLYETDVEDEEAVALLAAAAAAGRDDARLFLGDLLATGHHVERDHAQARALWVAVARESEDVDAVLAAAGALTRNVGTALHEPVAAAEGLERLLRTERVAASCAECWLALARSLRVRGEGDAARKVLAKGRRVLVDVTALADAIAAAPDVRGAVNAPGS